MPARQQQASLGRSARTNRTPRSDTPWTSTHRVEDPTVGDALDVWRVEAYEPGRLLRLSAEMKLPGRAWLEFEVVPRDGGATMRQTALFDPAGLLGLAYWYGWWPVHGLVFSGMLRGIARAAANRRRERPGPFTRNA